MSDNKIKIYLFDKDNLTKTLIENYINELNINFELIKEADFNKELVQSDDSYKFIFIAHNDELEAKENDIKILADDSKNILFMLLNEPNSDLYVKYLRLGVKEFLIKPLVKDNFIKSIKNNYKPEMFINKNANTNSKIVVVSSQEQSCGKTFFAVNIAKEIADITKEKVLLLDFNNGLNNVSFSLDIDPAYDTNYFILNTNSKNYEKVFSNVSCFKNSSMYIISNGLYTGVDDNINTNDIENFINYIRKYYKYIVIDVNQNIDIMNFILYANSDIIMYLITPNLTSCEKNHKYIENNFTGRKIKIILNKYKPKDELKLNEIESAIGYDIFEKISMNLSVSLGSASRGKTIREINPNSDIAASFNKIAEYIIYRV